MSACMSDGVMFASTIHTCAYAHTHTCTFFAKSPTQMHAITKEHTNTQYIRLQHLTARPLWIDFRGEASGWLQSLSAGAPGFLPHLRGGGGAEQSGETGKTQDVGGEGGGVDMADSIKAAVGLKEKGNAAFVEGKVAEAMALYTQAYQTVSEVEPDTEEHMHERAHVQMACLINKAQAASTLGEYQGRDSEKSADYSIY